MIIDYDTHTEAALVAFSPFRTLLESVERPWHTEKDAYLRSSYAQLASE